MNSVKFLISPLVLLLFFACEYKNPPTSETKDSKGPLEVRIGYNSDNGVYVGESDPYHGSLRLMNHSESPVYNVQFLSDSDSFIVGREGLTKNCKELKAKEQCTVDVVFSPKRIGSYEGIITTFYFIDGQQKKALGLKFKGQGVAIPEDLDVSKPKESNYGPVGKKLNQFFDLKNYNVLPLENLTFASSSSTFIIKNQKKCAHIEGKTDAVEKCTIGVEITPQKVGFEEALMTISYTIGGDQKQKAVKLKAEGGMLEVDGNFGDLSFTVGEDINIPVKIKNGFASDILIRGIQDDFPLNIEVVRDKNLSTCLIGPLAPGSSCVLMLTPSAASEFMKDKNALISREFQGLEFFDLLYDRNGKSETNMVQSLIGKISRKAAP